LAIRIGDELDAILTTIATAAVLATAAAPARSQEIPNLNVDPVCRGIAQQASTVAEKGAAEMAGMASYTDLISCLEMARDARQLNQGK
jgi:hypothetical protein